MFKKACHRFIQQLFIQQLGRYKTIFGQFNHFTGVSVHSRKNRGSDDYVIKGGAVSIMVDYKGRGRGIKKAKY